MPVYRSATVPVDAGTAVAIQTTGFTASANKSYICDTNSAGFTVTLPATPIVGTVVGIKDFRGTFGVAAKGLTLARNGSNIEGAAANIIITFTGFSGEVVYVGGTQGWRLYPPMLSYNPVYA